MKELIIENGKKMISINLEKVENKNDLFSTILEWIGIDESLFQQFKAKLKCRVVDYSGKSRSIDLNDYLI